MDKSTHKHYHLQQLHCSTVYVQGYFTLVALILLLALSLTNDFIVNRDNPSFIAGCDDFVYLLVNVIGMCLIASLCYSVHYWYTYVHSAIWHLVLGLNNNVAVVAMGSYTCTVTTLVQLILKLCNTFIANHHNKFSQLAALKMIVDFNSSEVVMTFLHMPNQKQAESLTYTIIRTCK